ncbi:peptide-methionine (S)-S-oxide reductase MsrA [Aromatoleum aromaticum]|uniref:Peptide methionine sulfoxide reductase MsrA n=1 Tax=Aromatoleum aromaticum (strain DSM 19018 / LMG 30748 / EbN1) TaxID=76114 RepID=Q5P7X4_AROAE|nr:peptide-methionine (S)-S-oxide reductase MsrA [Aromatoleum aromaticum]NMG55479.1 peptide-methionine (S)-S-oxide reductase MsrA [Aromatoleum aromaticum]CAI06587.1 putative peptide methionine sulfoxide reductase msrA [Aromatoleum aromaticum EbN1]
MTTQDGGFVSRLSGRLASLLGLALIVAAAGAGHAVPATSPATAIFAGGCFWCMEPPFDRLDGVASTTSGYIGGHVPNPAYEAVSSGRTGHAEAVRIEYDPEKISYEQLLDVFWRNIDPTDPGGQFCDRGSQYRAQIFYQNDGQRAAAERSRAALVANKPFAQPVITEIVPATKFYPAEEYHQDYYLKNPLRYKFYRHRCGRDERLEFLWGVDDGEKK